MSKSGSIFRSSSLLFIPLVLLAAYGWAQEPIERHPPVLTHRFVGPPDHTSISCELNANKIYVPVRINQTGPYWFILDSGSASNVLDTEAAKSLGITLKNPWEARGAGEKTLTGAVGSNVSLRLAGLELTQDEIDVVPLNMALAAVEGRKVDGLLGYDFLSRFVVQIDYVQRQVSIFDPKNYHYSGVGESIPIEVIRGNIFVSAFINLPNQERVPGTFLIDTAWRSALTFTAPFVAAQKLARAVPKTVDAITGMGIGGPTVDEIARIPKLQLGRYSMENFIADFSHAKAGVLSQSDFSGIIGAEILRRFKVTLDYPHNRMILEANAAFATPYEFDMSGLFLTSESSLRKAFKVYSVINGSAGAQAGLREGDVIESIDDRPASGFTLDQVRRMFKQGEGKQHWLTIKRGTDLLRIKLQLRRII